MGAVPVSSSWLGRDHRGPAYSFPLALKSPVNCPFTVRLREAKNFGARVEAIFSARLTMPIGSDSQSADDVHRLLPFPGLPGLKAARGIGSPEARFFGSGVGVETGIS
jgi:hypothetical protein